MNGTEALDISSFQYANKEIDYWNCPIEEFEKELKRLKDLSGFYDSKQNGEKLFINSVYGSIASVFCVLYKLDVAEAITLQGQDLNHYSENAINKYFSGLFQEDTELHKKLGIQDDVAKTFKIQYGRSTDNGPLPKERKEYSHIDGDFSMTVAGDTDSLYVEFGRLTKYFNIPVDKQTKFVVDLWENGLQPYMFKIYDEYARMYNCDKNEEVLELEKICRTALLYAKKHYAMEEVWEEPGVYLGDMEEIVYKGLEVIQGSTPPYARKCQKDMIEFVLRSYINDERPTYQSLIDKLKKYKSEMEAQPVEDIAKGASIGDYEKFILDDKQKLVVGLHCPIHVKASGFYNHTLLTNKKFLSKYSRLKTGEKCKWYYTKKPGVDVFAFAPNHFPIEFAPPVDYETQFEKMILNPLNKLIAILGYDELNVNLCYSEELF